MILFGKPPDQLTDDQQGLLTQRAVTAAASIGAAQLQDRLGRQMGVDVISVGALTHSVRALNLSLDLD